ncbi:MAG: tRNA uridine-5-carboxymethylaminomethyl(34) synthesis GTPase MnmE [Proteobacteria bacterium]|nr:MAG: tRNA uridine-5-carboxymethylaminomethyl(34) synthesis GTPase MnmE [Pseudomonadota bacterium]
MTPPQEHSSESTIAALATAPFPAGLAVVRVSGPKTKTALRAIFRSKKNPVDDPRSLIYGDLIDFKTNQVIDNALAVYMPAPHSYTGEDVAELQCHGSPLLVQKILGSLFAFGITPAEPGEFTKRAFLNGKVDLVQAEAICELINAASEQALKIAGEHLKGRFSGAISEIGDPLRNLLAEMEARIDFPEEDVPAEELDALGKALALAKHNINKLLETFAHGHLVKEGFRVLLCGRPNVGKSSILNLLLRSDRAIVTEVSGTTRDLIEEQAIISDFRFVFCDSAGIRDTDDKVERLGVELAKDRVGWADLVLFVVDATDTDRSWEEVLEYLRGRARKIWMVTNKVDLNPQAIGSFVCDSKTCAQNFYISAKTKDGLDSLQAALVDEVATSLPTRSEAGQVISNERQRNCLSSASESVSNALGALRQELPLEIICAEVRIALDRLDEIIGKTYTEDILGRIFLKFCIGK